VSSVALAAVINRIERVEEHDGIRDRVVEQRRVRYAAKPISRTRTPLAPADPEPLLVRLDRDEARMATRVLREGVLWASQIDEVELALVGTPRGVILVENRETLRHLLALADRDYLVVWVPGGPPPAEVALVRRLAELQPELRFHAFFDLDPAGIRIARLLEDRAGVPLESTGMTPELFARARKRLPLNRWDEAQLERYAGDAAALEPLRAAIAAAGAKVEQETIQRGSTRCLRRAVSQARRVRSGVSPTLPFECSGLASIDGASRTRRLHNGSMSTAHWSICKSA
jgi:hypothetical protein